MNKITFSNKFLRYISLFILITIVFLFESKPVSAQEYWSRIESPVTPDLHDCFFINANTGWISGDSGTIIKTTNGGNLWTIQNSKTFSSIEDIFFLDDLRGWAIAHEIFPDSNSFTGTIYLQTFDGGNNWIRSMYPDTNVFMTTLFFQDANTGFLGGIPSTILRTTNGGQNWTPTQIDSNLIFLLPVYKIKFYDQLTGYACGGFRDIAGTVWVTTNGGLVWRGTEVAPEPFFDVDMSSSNIAINAGGDLEFGSSVARTSNTGSSWFYDTLGVFGLATGISFRTPYEIWMTGSYSEKFIVSKDSGITWNNFYTLDSTALFDVTFPDTTYGYACGRGGTIFKYDRTSSGISNFSEILNEPEFRLIQNFPNPFNPETVISFELNKPSDIQLIVYDASGKEIMTLISEFMTPGFYSKTFPANDLSSGVYFYKLIADKFSESRKMVIIK